MRTPPFLSSFSAPAPLLALPLVVLLALGSSAQAQTLQPGLWEFQHQNQSAQQPGGNAMAERMAQMREQLKNMPPESRKMLEQQMAAQGVALDGSGGLRVCITPEQAQQAPIREGQREGRCTYSQVSHSGNTWKGHIRCQEPASEGDFTTTLYSPEHFATEAVVTSKEHGRMAMKTEGRRLGSDCGALAKKPAAQ
ncbi:DUF3617 domain-containing protein [Piscinibacter sp.]|uniref:DUF3617 domain-containing protein n=1 Tax=Piscinibacter sp. TaxID=1903157 RepID=UPI0035B47465